MQVGNGVNVVDQITNLIDSLSDGQKETLLIKLDNKVYRELKKRVNEMPDLVQGGNAISIKEVFEDA
jgi:hypothetical protein